MLSVSWSKVDLNHSACSWLIVMLVLAVVWSVHAAWRAACLYH
jgi:hypothetical protein